MEGGRETKYQSKANLLEHISCNWLSINIAFVQRFVRIIRIILERCFAYSTMDLKLQNDRIEIPIRMECMKKKVK